MGSSTRKKKEKAKDFQKQKLRVGKAKPKADNFTDTAFKSKSIVVSTQSIRVSAPSDSSQFTHNLSLASSSRSDHQRRDALAFLTSHVSTLPAKTELLLPTSILLPKLLPLILDGFASVRSQLLKFVRLLPVDDISGLTESILLFIRAGMTHLSKEIRIDALAFLEWLLDTAEEEVVGCPGGWLKTLRCFMSMMGWAITTEDSKWTSGSKVSFAQTGKMYPRQLQVFSKFLKAGLVESELATITTAEIISERLRNNAIIYPLTDTNFNMISTISNPYARLNLFGTPRDEDSEAYDDREARQRVFHKRFLSEVQVGVERARKEGGEIGRSAATLDGVLRNGLSDYNPSN